VTSPTSARTTGRTGAWGSLTDVPGFAVGHAQRTGDGWLTGVTVVLPPAGTVGAVDVRGGGPATRETDALAPTTLVPTVDAVCLTGGSAFGLASATGVMRWCEEHDRGFVVGAPDQRRRQVVPIVPAAAIFDLGRGGDPTARPDADLGHAAAAGASSTSVATGPVGAGTGALIAAGGLAGGIGSAALRIPVQAGSVVVGALAVVNAAGSPVDPMDGALLGRPFVPPGLPRPGVPAADQAVAVRDRLAAALAARATGGAGGRAHTTIAVVATDARLDPAAAWRLAASGHDGMARGLDPVHTMLDGDTVFALATGTVPLAAGELVGLQAAAGQAVLLAVLDAVLAGQAIHTPVLDVPGYLELCPSAEPVAAPRQP
jgi:putative pantetheine hydrolase